MRNVCLAFGAAIVVTVGLPADGKKFDPPPMPVGYDDPGPEPTDVAGVIAGALRQSLKDPASARDFQLCHVRVLEPVRALGPTIPWEASYRVRFFSVNAKNSFGGYTGARIGIATFRGGNLINLSLTANPPIDGRAVPGREACKPIPDDKFQQMMSHGTDH